jgi:hypothetical protein
MRYAGRVEPVDAEIVDHRSARTEKHKSTPGLVEPFAVLGVKCIVGAP